MSEPDGMIERVARAIQRMTHDIAPLPDPAELARLDGLVREAESQIHAALSLPPHMLGPGSRLGTATTLAQAEARLRALARVLRALDLAPDAAMQPYWPAPPDNHTGEVTT